MKTIFTLGSTESIAYVDFKVDDKSKWKQESVELVMDGKETIIFKMDEKFDFKWISDKINNLYGNRYTEVNKKTHPNFSIYKAKNGSFKFKIAFNNTVAIFTINNPLDFQIALLSQYDQDSSDISTPVKMNKPQRVGIGELTLYGWGEDFSHKSLIFKSYKSANGKRSNNWIFLRSSKKDDSIYDATDCPIDSETHSYSHIAGSLNRLLESDTLVGTSVDTETTPEKIKFVVVDGFIKLSYIDHFSKETNYFYVSDPRQLIDFLISKYDAQYDFESMFRAATNEYGHRVTFYKSEKSESADIAFWYTIEDGSYVYNSYTNGCNNRVLGSEFAARIKDTIGILRNPDQYPLDQQLTVENARPSLACPIHIYTSKSDKTARMVFSIIDSNDSNAVRSYGFTFRDLQPLWGWLVENNIDKIVDKKDSISGLLGSDLGDPDTLIITERNNNTDELSGSIEVDIPESHEANPLPQPLIIADVQFEAFSLLLPDDRYIGLNVHKSGIENLKMLLDSLGKLMGAPNLSYFQMFDVNFIINEYDVVITADHDMDGGVMTVETLAKFNATALYAEIDRNIKKYDVEKPEVVEDEPEQDGFNETLNEVMSEIGVHYSKVELLDDKFRIDVFCLPITKAVRLIHKPKLEFRESEGLLLINDEGYWVKIWGKSFFEITINAITELSPKSKSGERIEYLDTHHRVIFQRCDKGIEIGIEDTRSESSTFTGKDSFFIYKLSTHDTNRLLNYLRNIILHGIENSMESRG